MYADIEQAQAYGASGVPFFVIDRKYGVSGAQPAETFRQVLDRAWADSHPALEVVGGGDACGPDGCDGLSPLRGLSPGRRTRGPR